MAKVYNKRDVRTPADAIYIGRPSKWGNPFVIGRDGTRHQVIAKYETWLLANKPLLAQLGELRGKNLICYCAPQARHGDVLARLANGPELTRDNLGQRARVWIGGSQSVNELDERLRTRIDAIHDRGLEITVAAGKGPNAPCETI